MTLAVVVLPDATADLRQAAHWLEGVWPGLGYEFRDEVQTLLARIAEFPQRYQPYYRNHRRAMLRRFDYTVVYRIRADVVQVIAVQHCRLSPLIASDALQLTG